MSKFGYRPAQGLIQRHLLWGVGKMIVSPDHVCNLHQRIVDHHDVVINRHCIGTQNDGIADDFIGELDLSMYDVVEANGMLRNFQPNGTGFTSCTPPPGFLRINVAASTRVNWLAAFRQCPVTLSLQIVFGAEAKISLAFTEEPLSVFAIDFEPVGLAVGNIRPSHVRTFIPVESQPLEVADELIFESCLATLHIRVFNAQHHRAALLPGEQPVE